MAIFTDQKRILDPRDTELRTLGCRHSDPRICKNNQTPNKCAFVRPDNVCLMPAKSWKRLYAELVARDR